LDFWLKYLKIQIGEGVGTISNLNVCLDKGKKLFMGILTNRMAY
jgi:hypothetical protein